MASRSGKSSKTKYSQADLSKFDQILEAAVAGNVRRVKKLIKEFATGKGIKDAVAHIRDGDGRGLLQAAAVKGRINVCRYLLEELKLNVDEKDKEGYTALLHASLEGDLSTVEYLIESGADPAALNKHDTTALHLAALEGNIEVIKFLLSKGANVNATSAIGTPLQLAAQLGDLDVLQSLLDNGAEPNLVNLIPTPLHFCMSRSLECTKLLIQAGADPNGSSCGMTPLATAAKIGAPELIQCLVDAGADPNVVNDIGLTPIELAALNTNHREVEILFPITSPIATCSDWSIAGIQNHVNSEEAKEQVKGRLKEKHSNALWNGNAAARKKDNLQAAFYYTQAIAADPTDGTGLVKRSHCWTELGDGENGWADAKAGIALRPDWTEAYLIGGEALCRIGRLDLAAETFLLGLKLDPDHKELRKSYQLISMFNAFTS